MTVRELRVFICGSSKTTNPESEYYRKELPELIKQEIDKHIQRGEIFIVGDAPGIDTQVQDYLYSKEYEHVEIYVMKEARYLANSKWKTIKCNVYPMDDGHFNFCYEKCPEEGSREWYALKDIMLCSEADSAIAIPIYGGSRATRNNIERLKRRKTSLIVYELFPDKKQDFCYSCEHYPKYGHMYNPDAWFWWAKDVDSRTYLTADLPKKLAKNLESNSHNSTIRHNIDILSAALECMDRQSDDVCCIGDRKCITCNFNCEQGTLMQRVNALQTAINALEKEMDKEKQDA